jgi:tetratricopeptide (TPR) repeat protein
MKSNIISCKQARLLAALCCCLLVLSGCNLYESGENKNSRKAKMEEAAICIDKGEYEKAESILNKIYNKNPETTNGRLLQLLSNSISGQIGIDSFRLLEIIDDLPDGNSSRGIDMTGLVLGDEAGRISRAGLAYKIDRLYLRYHNSEGNIFYADGAIAFLEQISEKTPDHHAQLGLLSLVDSVLLLGEIIAYDLGVDTITLTKQGIKNAYISKNALFPYNAYTQDFVENEPAHYTRIDRLNSNIQRIETSIEAILELSGAKNAEENDLADIFNDFLDEITNYQRKITFNQIVIYITNLL